MKYSKEGRFLKTWGSKGTGPGEFNTPHAIVVDAKGLVYVGDRENKRIQVFDADGGFLREWTQLGSPDTEGRLLGTLGSPGKLPGQFSHAHHLGLGKDGSLYVAEILNWRVQKFAPR